MESMTTIKRLDFTLPKFKRIAWVSTAAKTTWDPILRQIIKAQPKIFGYAVQAGLYPCALVKIAAWQIFGLETYLRDRLGLRMVVLETTGGSSDPESQEPIYHRIVIGQSDNVAAFLIAWQADDWERIFTLLNVPNCCRIFHQRMRDEWRLMDATLAQAFNTPNVEKKSHVLQFSGEPALNTLMQWLDIQLLSHAPCSMQCQTSQILATDWVRTGRENGFAEEMTALMDILAWPAEWSALHGIAEIKTPILKISTHTDATAEKYSVHRLATSYPQEGASGINFPYHQPKFSKITHSKSFKQGLANPIIEIEDHTHFQTD